jgi:hypothetical protein
MSLRRFATLVISAAVVVPALAHAAARGNAKASVAGKAVSIEYGRPSLAGRDMLSRATPGEPWRMGADDPTKLTTEADLAFGPARVPRGTYILTATKDEAGGWTLNVLKQDRSKLVDVPLTAGTLPESVETFTIDLRGEKDKGEVELKWGTTSLKAAFSGK